MADKRSDKKLIELKYNLKLVYEAIQNKKFNKAVTIFSRIEAEFDHTYPNFNDQIKEEIQKLKREFILYLRINEAYSMAEEGNLTGLRTELDYIHNDLYGLDKEEQVKPLIEYLTGNYKFCLEYYTFRLTKKHFMEGHQSVKGLIGEGKLTKAMKHFSQLVIVYNKLQDYCDDYEKENYYSQLKSLFRDISTHHIVNLHKKQVVEETKQSKIIKQKKEEKIKFHDNFNKIRDMLNRGEIEKAAEFLKKV